jgi:hypothetical protein
MSTAAIDEIMKIHPARVIAYFLRSASGVAGVPPRARAGPATAAAANIHALAARPALACTIPRIGTLAGAHPRQRRWVLQAS